MAELLNNINAYYYIVCAALDIVLNISGIVNLSCITLAIVFCVIQQLFCIRVSW